MTSVYETEIARLTRERDEAHTRYNALLWQIANEGCVAARVGEGTRECGLPVCGLCRLVHERDFYKQNSAALESLLRECNAVCLCGCPDAEHESYGADGESCGNDEHECIRVAPAVLAYVEDLRQQWADLGEDYEGLRARINPPHPSWDTSCARCGRDLTVSSATCGECCAETPAAGVVEVTPAPPPSDAVREAAERLSTYLPVWIAGGTGEDAQLRYRIENLLDALAARGGE